MSVSLPDEILLEILFRLNAVPAALFRCATTCKQWRGLVAEPAFLRRCWPDQDTSSSSSLIGFFTQESRHGASSLVLTLCFNPTKRSVLGPGGRTLSSIMTAAPAGIFDNALPLVSCHGLLLVRLDTHATRGYLNPVVLDLAICNFLTGVCHVIPTLKFGSDFHECKWKGYVILAGTDCRSNDDVPVCPSDSSLFKVVILSTYEDDRTKYSLHTFSSEEACWRVRTGSIDGVGLPINKYMSSSLAVVHRGVAHWLFHFYYQLCLGVLTLNMRTGHVSLVLVKLPFQMNLYLNYRPRLTLAVNGALSLLWIQTIGTKMEIWEQQEDQPNKDGRSEWVRTRTGELKELGKRANKGRHPSVLGERCGTLLVHDTIQGVYTADLETGIGLARNT